MRSVRLVAVVAVASACGRSALFADSLEQPSGPDASIAFDDAAAPTDTGAPDASVTPDDASVTPNDLGVPPHDGAPDSVRDAPFDCNPSKVPVDVPPRATVRFVFRNPDTQPFCVLAAGSNCEPFAVVSNRLVHLATPFSCGCQCSTPPRTADYVCVPPNGSYTITWDAREVLLSKTEDDCGPDAAVRCATRLVGQRVPLDPGAYVATVVDVAESYLTATAGCVATATGFHCEASGPPPSQPQICDSLVNGATNSQARPITIPDAGSVEFVFSAP